MLVFIVCVLRGHCLVVTPNGVALSVDGVLIGAGENVMYFDSSTFYFRGYI